MSSVGTEEKPSSVFCQIIGITIRNATRTVRVFPSSSTQRSTIKEATGVARITDTAGLKTFFKMTNL